MNATPHHEPVMPAEVIALLEPSRGGLFVDCTTGLGGHSALLLEHGADRLLGLDRDADALGHRGRAAARRSAIASSSCTRIIGSSARVLEARGIAGVDGVLADLGVSSMQLDGRRTRIQLPPRRAARHADGPDARDRRSRTC